MFAIIHSQHWDAQNRLAEFGLSIDILQKAVEAGYLGFISCTDNDPPATWGYTAWAHTLRRLREQLVPFGWERNNSLNFPRTFSEEHKISIIVSTGDEGTGRGHLHPRTKSSKGQLTEQAVYFNSIQGTLKGFLPDEETKTLPNSAYTTWILLFYVTATEIRAELSLPSIITDGDILAWKERIILPSIEVDPGVLEGGPEEDPGPEIEVPVSRKK